MRLKGTPRSDPSGSDEKVPTQQEAELQDGRRLLPPAGQH